MCIHVHYYYSEAIHMHDYELLMDQILRVRATD